MRYTQGRLGRVFVLKFDHGDDLSQELQRLASQEKIKSGVCVFLGALQKGRIVTGPKSAVIPPKPHWTGFKDGWEVFGVGSIFAGPDGPVLHLHSSLGKGKKALTGCVRKDAKVFLVIEAFVFELKGVRARKGVDAATGLNLLRILSRV